MLIESVELARTSRSAVFKSITGRATVEWLRSEWLPGQTSVTQAYTLVQYLKLRKDGKPWLDSHERP